MEKDICITMRRISLAKAMCHKIKKMLAPLKQRYDKPKQHIEKHKHNFAIKGPESQSYGFSSSHVWI